jgi:glycolate oxidase FAD binding subunit
MSAAVNSIELDPSAAQTFWNQLREQELPAFANLKADDTLYRLALPAACGPLTLDNISRDIILEWHGQQRWLQASGDDLTFKSIKALASAHGGHATRFKQGANVDRSNQRFTLLSEQAHSVALEAVQQRLRASFDPAGIFATARLP